MPQKNAIKTYVEQGFYHVYNRGVEKRAIFEDPRDYAVFLGYLMAYLSPPEKDSPSPTKRTVLSYVPKNYHDTIELHAFALMPNHFHLLIKQTDERTMESFFRSLATRYSMYFNRHYGRVGGLFQGRYKAVIVTSDEQLVHLSRYIHMNPLSLGLKTKEL